jgi:predicted AlkP superfamily phosphohydrolase/phosphomutase
VLDAARLLLALLLLIGCTDARSSSTGSDGTSGAAAKGAVVAAGDESAASAGSDAIATGKHGKPGIFVLGVDGMDPVILQRLMDAGQMPNFSKFAESGSFVPLGTANPPQSPVAWSTFVTGMNPGGHGVYDFVHRDPKTYLPISSATLPQDDPGSAVSLFGYYIPLGGETPKNTRGGVPFWDALLDAGVDVEVYRMPGNYPPPPSDAKVLSGMGTVDMRGGYGTYTWFTTYPVPDREGMKGDIQQVSLSDDDLDGKPDTVRGTLKGPPDLFRLPPGHVPGDGDYLTVPVTFRIDPDEDAVLVEVGGSRALLEVGEWSDWLPVHFHPLPGEIMPLEGIVRIYVRQIRPELEIYASPVNISPASPAQDISTPSAFANELYALLGYFYTQGMPEETNALKDRIFTDDDYARQVALVQQDTAAMLDLALARFEPGDMTFMYVSDIDLQCHMLWRLGDPKDPSAPPHPAFAADAHAAAEHGDDIEGYYRHVDELLGVVLQRVPPGTLVVVMSDHGFQPFTRKVNLNAWLRDEGYLVLKDGKKTGKIALGDVDWSKTRAYGLGFNALYVNERGREAEGIVDPADSEALLREIGAKLEALRDGEASVVKRAFLGREIYSGPRAHEAPDMVVGYDVGYGCSDESTLGEIDEVVIEDNLSRWSGNHLMDPDVVPGVLLTNRKLPRTGYALPDVTATLLAHYGVPLPEGMEGKDVFAH